MSEQSNHTSHEVSLAAEPIFHIGSFKVTNSFANSVFVMILLVVVFVLAGMKIKKIPGGLQNFFEFILESALNFIDSITNDRKKSEKFLPIVLSLFLFILVNNWLGLFPGFGTIGTVEAHEGKAVFVPFLRGGTADLNTTLALAIFSLLAVHIFAVLKIGLWNHLNKFINIKVFLEIPSKIKNDKTVLLSAPVMFFIGIIEIIGEITKLISLSFRLFGNIFAGEVLISSIMTMAAFSAFFLPIPFMFLELLLGAIQASIFTILVLVFMNIMSQEHH